MQPELLAPDKPTNYLIDAREALKTNNLAQRKLLANNLEVIADELLPEDSNLSPDQQLTKQIIFTTAEALRQDLDCKPEHKVRAYLHTGEDDRGQSFYLMANTPSGEKVLFDKEYLNKALHMNVLDLESFENIDGDWNLVARRADPVNTKGSLLSLSANSEVADYHTLNSVVVVDVCPGRILPSVVDVNGEESLDDLWRDSDKNIYGHRLYVPFFILPEEITKVLPRCYGSSRIPLSKYKHCKPFEVTGDSRSRTEAVYVDQDNPTIATKIINSGYIFSNHPFERTLFHGSLWAENLAGINWQKLHMMYVENFINFGQNFYFEDNFRYFVEQLDPWYQKREKNRCEFLKPIAAHTAKLQNLKVTQNIRIGEISALTGKSLFKLHNNDNDVQNANNRWDKEKPMIQRRILTHASFARMVSKTCP